MIDGDIFLIDDVVAVIDFPVTFINDNVVMLDGADCFDT